MGLLPFLHQLTRHLHKPCALNGHAPESPSRKAKKLMKAFWSRIAASVTHAQTHGPTIHAACVQRTHTHTHAHTHTHTPERPSREVKE